MIAALRLALGTLTAIPAGGVTITPRRATGAMALAPVAAVPLGVLLALVCWAGSVLELPALAVAFVAVGLLAAGSRALHLDGLADVADGLTASYDRERSLAVMKSGAAGPAGVAAIVVVLGVQVGALTAVVGRGASVTDVVVIAGAVVMSRAALWICCVRSVPPARPDGLGAVFARRLPITAVVAGWVLAAGLAWLIDPWRGPLAVAAAAAVVVLLIRRSIRRFGGVTGDVFGAAIELALATLLLVALPR